MHMTDLLHQAGSLNAEEIQTTKAEIERQHARRTEILEGSEAFNLALMEIVETFSRTLGEKMESLKRLLLEDIDIALAEQEARLRRLTGFDENIAVTKLKEAAE